ncbi:MAG: oxaloacetate decarboxylase [Lachnospiraceae bacterium]|nr:oxaloacetate decarboxylase [Lachnospiraceae bacterium]
MKKVAGIILLIAGVITSAAGVIALFRVKANAPSNISVIGGADGPTAIFLAGKFGLPMYGPVIAGVVLVLIGMVLLAYRKDV